MQSCTFQSLSHPIYFEWLACRQHDIEAQIERARKVARTDAADDNAPQASELKRDETDQPLRISLTATQPDKPNGQLPPVPKFDVTFAEASRYTHCCSKGGGPETQCWLSA